MPTFEELQKSMETLVRPLKNKIALGAVLNDFELGQFQIAEYVLNFIKNY